MLLVTLYASMLGKMLNGNLSHERGWGVRAEGGYNNMDHMDKNF